jgi:hypothetical protein
LSPVTLAAIACTAAILALAGWFLIPILSGLPWRPSTTERIVRALELADVQPGEIVYDLGSGDGRVLLAASSVFQARAVGIEWSPIQYLWSLIRVRRRHPGPPIHVHWGDCFRTRLTDADVVVAYMTPSLAPRLHAALTDNLRRGARVVTLAFELAGLEPVAFDETHLIYLYRWPPSPGSLGTLLAKRRLREA